MNAQLTNVQRELQEATSRIQQLVERLSDATWTKRPDHGGWSVAQCVMHLNKTTEAFLPNLDAAIVEGWRRKLSGTGPFRRDFPGWLLCSFVEPPYRIKVKTPAAFDPRQAESAEIVMRAWEFLQGEVCLRITAADGLALDKVKVVSPFVGRMKYNLLSALMVIPAHQRRHAWQAEQTLKNSS